MFSFFRRRRRWPKLTFDDIRKRARLLVIDDNPVPIVSLFERDGYLIEKWDDVRNIGDLEKGTFDVIILDIGGVGKAISADEGFGVLRHVKRANPSQMILACSGQVFSLKDHEFFLMADAAIEGSADYVDFKHKVDDLLRKRFSIQYYVDRIAGLARPHVVNTAGIRKAAEHALSHLRTGHVEKYLKRHRLDEQASQSILQIARAATSLFGKAYVK